MIEPMRVEVFHPPSIQDSHFPLLFPYKGIAALSVQLPGLESPLSLGPIPWSGNPRDPGRKS